MAHLWHVDGVLKGFFSSQVCLLWLPSALRLEPMVEYWKTTVQQTWRSMQPKQPSLQGAWPQSWSTVSLWEMSCRYATSDPKTRLSGMFLVVLIHSLPQSSADAPYIARHVGLRCGVPIPVPALTVNRLCGSGFQSIINGTHVSLLWSSFIIKNYINEHWISCF